MNGPVGQAANKVGQAGVALLNGDLGAAYAAVTPPAHTVVGKLMTGDLGAALAAIFPPPPPAHVTVPGTTAKITEAIATGRAAQAVATPVASSGGHGKPAKPLN